MANYFSNATCTLVLVRMGGNQNIDVGRLKTEPIIDKQVCTFQLNRHQNNALLWSCRIHPEEGGIGSTPPMTLRGS